MNHFHIQIETNSNSNFMIKIPRLVLMSVTFVLVFFVYGPFLGKHYALDDYLMEANGNQGGFYMQNGRFLSGIILNILTQFKINIVTQQSYFTLLSLFMLAFAVFLVIRLFYELRNEWSIQAFLILCLSSIVSLCHLFMVGWFLFPETVFFMMTGLILSILAVYPLREGLNTFGGFKSYGLLLLAVMFYQAAVAFFIVFGMFYIIIKQAHQPVRHIIKRFISFFTVYGLAGLTEVLIIRLFNHPSARTNFNNLNPFDHVRKIVWSLHQKLESTHLGLTPILAFGIIMTGLIGICTFFIWKRSNRSDFSRVTLLLSFGVISSFIATLLPHFLTSASAVDVSPRSIIALMSIPGMVCLFILLYPSFTKKKSMLYIVMGFLIVFFLSNTLLTYFVETSRFATNRLDKEVARMICREISKYEQKTGNIVTRIAYRHDRKPVLSYPGLVSYGNFRALGRDWTVIPLITITSGRRFQHTAMPKTVFNQYFKYKNWNYFSVEQIVFQKNTLYLMLY